MVIPLWYGLARHSIGNVELAFSTRARRFFHFPYTSLVRCMSSAPRGAEAVRFSIYVPDAHRKFEEWCKNDAPMLIQPSVHGISPVMIPHWVFAADVEVRSKSGTFLQSRRETGPHMQVYAGHVYPRDLISVAKVDPYWARPFEPSMLHVGSEGSAEVHPFETFEATAWQLARTAAIAHIQRDQPSLGTLSADQVRFSNVSSRRVYMPVYEVQYGFWGADLRMFISGATGNGYGIQQSLGSPMLSRFLRSIKNLTIGQATVDPRRIPGYLDLLLKMAGGDIRVLTGLLALLRPFAKILLWPPFLVGSLLAVGGYAASAILHPLAKQRISFAQWEETRAAEKKLQQDMTDEWVFKAPRGRTDGPGPGPGPESRTSSSSSSNSTGGQQARQQQAPRQQAKAKSSGRAPPAVDQNDYYAVLGVDRSVDTAGVQAAFRKQLMMYHPDHAEASGWEPEAASARTRIIIKAYGVLRDTNKRSAYDATYHRR